LARLPVPFSTFIQNILRIAADVSGLSTFCARARPSERVRGRKVGSIL
jgi:hypothetical protein